MDNNFDLKNQSMPRIIANFLNGCGNVDQGVETVLNVIAFDAITGIIVSLYGARCGLMFQECFDEREDGSFVCSTENAGDQFLDFLQGNTE